VSIQENFEDTAAGTQAVRRLLGGLPLAVELLLAGNESQFVAANSNTSWAHTSAKRLLDLAITVPALIFLAPLLALLALLISLDSPGPVLFRQKRLGYRGRPFDILKLRTMTVLEDGETIEQARRDDARTTRVGRWLRAFSLDELPQLINVIEGEMSLIGPRPHARAHDDFYARLIAGYPRRQDVKPGITGWAQIHGLRGATPTVDSMSRRVDFDVWYANHASFALDVKILLRTPLEVLRRRNAY
jgi:lipopolysaccharide/colanic/teichoic acid biosynthesis glycosyltransferase